MEKSKEIVISSDAGQSTKDAELFAAVELSPEKFPCLQDDENSMYHIQWISQKGLKKPVITQNKNGPCPLITIINVLLMKERITLPFPLNIITAKKLIEYLNECILATCTKATGKISFRDKLALQLDVQDALTVLPKLQTGLDVNIRFTGIADFEATTEIKIFNLLQIPLFHGWLIDPCMKNVVKVIGNSSYNQLMDKINAVSSTDIDIIPEILVTEHFLQRSASQLTPYGLCELTSKVNEGDICVLFRKKHFRILIKYKNSLYQLVTDQDLLNLNIVWETLKSIDGDAEFMDSNFALVPSKTSDVPIPPNVFQEQQTDQLMHQKLSTDLINKIINRNKNMFNIEMENMYLKLQLLTLAHNQQNFIKYFDQSSGPIGHLACKRPTFVQPIPAKNERDLDLHIQTWLDNGGENVFEVLCEDSSTLKEPSTLIERNPKDFPESSFGKPILPTNETDLDAHISTFQKPSTSTESNQKDFPDIGEITDLVQFITDLQEDIITRPVLAGGWSGKCEQMDFRSEKCSKRARFS